MSVWTTTKPTTPGWYWFRHATFCEGGMIVEVRADVHGQLVARSWSGYASFAYAEWSSEPIAVPDEPGERGQP